MPWTICWSTCIHPMGVHNHVCVSQMHSCPNSSKNTNVMQSAPKKKIYKFRLIKFCAYKKCKNKCAHINSKPVWTNNCNFNPREQILLPIKSAITRLDKENLCVIKPYRVWNYCFMLLRQVLKCHDHAQLSPLTPRSIIALYAKLYA